MYFTKKNRKKHVKQQVVHHIFVAIIDSCLKIVYNKVLLYIIKTSVITIKNSINTAFSIFITNIFLIQ